MKVVKESWKATERFVKQFLSFVGNMSLPEFQFLYAHNLVSWSEESKIVMSGLLPGYIDPFHPQDVLLEWGTFNSDDKNESNRTEILSQIVNIVLNDLVSDDVLQGLEPTAYVGLLSLLHKLSSEHEGNDSYKTNFKQVAEYASQYLQSKGNLVLSNNEAQKFEKTPTVEDLFACDWVKGLITAGGAHLSVETDSGKGALMQELPAGNFGQDDCVSLAGGAAVGLS